MSGLVGYIATGIVSLIVGLILRSLEARPKIVFWQPHYALFEVPEPRITLQTDAINIQNLGRKEAENVEIIFKSRPDFFKLTPPLQYTEETTPHGEFIIRISSLGAKEFFTLHILSYATPPKVESVRSKSGQGELIPFQMQRKFPRWFELLSLFLLLLGLGFIIYWLIMAVIFISKNIGIV
jgi:hypothetical protein